MNKWISVKEMLPDTEELDVSDSVLILFHRRCSYCCGLDSGDNISIGYYSEMDGIREWNLSEPLSQDYLPKDHEKQIRVTHWQFLPLPPESE